MERHIIRGLETPEGGALMGADAARNVLLRNVGEMFGLSLRANLAFMDLRHSPARQAYFLLGFSLVRFRPPPFFLDAGG